MKNIFKKVKRKRMVLYTAVIMLVVGIIFSLSNSYAYFETSIAGSNVTLGVGKLIHSLNSDVRLKSGEKKQINLFVKSNDDIASKYQVYYKSSDDLTNVTVGYSSDSVNTPSGDIDANSSKSITIVLENNSSNEVSVEIGVRGGLANNSIEDIVLEEGEERIVDVLEKPIELDDYDSLLNNGEALVFSNWYDYPQIIDLNTSKTGAIAAYWYGIVLIKNNGWSKISVSYNSIIGTITDDLINTSQSLISSYSFDSSAEYIFIHTATGTKNYVNITFSVS